MNVVSVRVCSREWKTDLQGLNKKGIFLFKVIWKTICLSYHKSVLADWLFFIGRLQLAKVTVSCSLYRFLKQSINRCSLGENNLLQACCLYRALIGKLRFFLFNVSKFPILRDSSLLWVHEVQVTYFNISFQWIQFVSFSIINDAVSSRSIHTAPQHN